LAASWYTSGNISYAVAYTRIDDTHADTVKTDFLGLTSSFSALIPGSSGWGSNDAYKGVQSVIRDSGNSQDRVYGACKAASIGQP